MNRMTLGLFLLLAGPGGVAAQAPTARIVTIASIPGEEIYEAVSAPGARRVYYVTARNQLWMYDRVGKAASLVTRDSLRLSAEGAGLAVSPKGDLLAFVSDNEDGKPFIWTLPLSPATGLANGPARRVSVSEGDSPGFSPDGQWIAFGAYHRPAPGQELTIIPVTGGKERAIAPPVTGILPVRWTPDGRSIVFGVNSGGSHTAIKTVSVGGGPVSDVVEVGEPNPGLSPDGRFVVYRARNGAGEPHAAILADRAGKEIAPIRSLANKVVFGWSGNTSLLAAVPATRRSLRVVSIATGATRELVDAASTATYPAWSPDSRRIATVTQRDGRDVLLIMNADGTQKQTHALRESVFADRTMIWSPDGRFIVYRGGETNTLNLVTLADGAERQLVRAEGGVFEIRWRPDGRSILYSATDALSAAGRRGAYEVTLDGTSHLVRDFSVLFPSINGHWPAGDDAFLLASDSALFKVPLSAAQPQRVAIPFAPNGNSVVSSDGRRMASVHSPAGLSTFTAIDVISTDSSSRTTIKLPFEASRVTRFPLSFHPDGRNLVVVGRNGSDAPWGIYLVPINGDPPRRIVEVGNNVRSLTLSVSPDGLSLAYTPPGEPISTLLEVDVSALVKPQP